ncbi:MAG: hypothetical protein KAY24_16375 [Candidatus Eisenbacteria sp.]|nr:hypothetical protein [Candidatus Eisenbacteria bacterium]
MHSERLDEPIKVRADFRGGEITPLLFKRGRSRVRVMRVNSRWLDREGRRQLCYFSVTADSGDIYQLRFDTGDLTWRVESVMYEG